LTQIFRNPFYDDFGTWPLAYIPYGGADFGEVVAVAEAVGEATDETFYKSWTAFAARLSEEAEVALKKGHRASARDLFLRASVFYATSYHPLYGDPVNPQLLEAFRNQVLMLNHGLSLFETPATPLRIPFEQSSMPAYLIPAAGHECEVRPLIIFTNGYDATITDMYFASAVAASRRGYHCLLFDGPGQGEMLYEQGIHLRPDWETVVAAVVDFAIAQPNVNPERIALSGWSLGGHLASRAASGEPRIAALIADPATWSITGDFPGFVTRLTGVVPEKGISLGDLDEATVNKLDTFIRRDRGFNWKIVQRGFWVHGVDNLRDYLISAEQFTMDGRAELIRCPTLLTMAENDSLGAKAPFFLEALSCPKTLLRFSSSEGAGDHCEMQNRSLLNRKAFDWLDEQFSIKAE
jgi:alpha-beta hydrolase superfamily lysophospholipase